MVTGDASQKHLDWVAIDCPSKNTIKLKLLSDSPYSLYSWHLSDTAKRRFFIENALKPWSPRPVGKAHDARTTLCSRLIRCPQWWMPLYILWLCNKYMNKIETWRWLNVYRSLLGNAVWGPARRTQWQGQQTGFVSCLHHRASHTCRLQRCSTQTGNGNCTCIAGAGWVRCT